jgi:hypothetical protein
MKRLRKVNSIATVQHSCFTYFSGACIFLTIALDLVISDIAEPVRFLIEAKARISESSTQDISETIWSSFKKITPFTEEFDMILKQVNRR